MPSWDDLKSKQRTRREPDAAADELAEACADALTTPAGRRLLEVLEDAYLFAVPPSTFSDSALREHNAQRQLVRQLRLKMEAGLAARKAKAEKAQ